MKRVIRLLTLSGIMMGMLLMGACTSDDEPHGNDPANNAATANIVRTIIEKTNLVGASEDGSLKVFPSVITLGSHASKMSGVVYVKGTDWYIKNIVLTQRGEEKVYSISEVAKERFWKNGYCNTFADFLKVEVMSLNPQTAGLGPLDELSLIRFTLVGYSHDGFKVVLANATGECEVIGNCAYVTGAGGDNYTWGVSQSDFCVDAGGASYDVKLNFDKWYIKAIYLDGDEVEIGDSTCSAIWGTATFDWLTIRHLPEGVRISVSPNATDEIRTFWITLGNAGDSPYVGCATFSGSQEGGYVSESETNPDETAGIRPVYAVRPL